MRKLLFLAALFSCLSFSNPNYSTTWAGTGINQALTLSALKDAVGIGILIQSSATTIPTSLRLVKISDLTTYSMNTYYSFPWKTSLQIVTKGDFFATYIDVSPGQSSCGGGNPTLLVFPDGIVVDPGVRVFTDHGHTIPFVGNGAGYWYGLGGGGSAIQISSSGYIIDYYGC